jgi:hypothetical protein
MNLLQDRLHPPSTFRWKFSPEYPSFPKKRLEDMNINQLNSCVEALANGALIAEKFEPVIPESLSECEDENKSTILVQPVKTRPPTIPQQASISAPISRLLSMESGNEGDTVPKEASEQLPKETSNELPRGAFSQARLTKTPNGM